MANYAVRYPQHVKKLVLLSPLGVKNISNTSVRTKDGEKKIPAWVDDCILFIKYNLDLDGLKKVVGQKVLMSMVDWYIRKF